MCGKISYCLVVLVRISLKLFIAESYVFWMKYQLRFWKILTRVCLFCLAEVNLILFIGDFSSLIALRIVRCNEMWYERDVTIFYLTPKSSILFSNQLNFKDLYYRDRPLRHIWCLYGQQYCQGLKTTGFHGNTDHCPYRH